MEPWTQPTTAPEQPDLARDSEAVHDRLSVVERGWMEPPWFPAETPRTSFAITALAASVAIGFVLATVVLAPLMLRWLAS
jgi:hypothetical protein